MTRLDISKFAQINKASVDFGDLTVFVGPQATGKSLVLQLFKFALDRPVIASRLKENGLTWDKSANFGMLSTFLGEGYDGAFSPKTKITLDDRPIFDDKINRSSSREPKVFFVPAQRVLTMSNGWPRPFMDFEAGDPFVARQFSQNILEAFTRGLGSGAAPVFPPKDRLKAAIREKIERSIFHGGRLLLRNAGGRRRLIIQYDGERSDEPIELPFFEWSAGQREFAPLLLGLYELLPAGKVGSHSYYKWVVIEEPEMGLHPDGINSVMLLAFELLARGYKVCMSTHSPYVLELIWAIKVLQKSKSPRRAKAILEALNIEGSGLKPLAEKLLKKSLQAYALTFDADRQHQCTNISSFDLESGDPVIAGWGGVTNLSAVVSRAVARGV